MAVPIRICSQTDTQIIFEEEPYPYTIRAAGERFIVLTRPMLGPDPNYHWYDANDEDIYYTIMDKKLGVRGSHNRSLDEYDFFEQAECERCLSDLENPNSGVRLDESGK